MCNITKCCTEVCPEGIKITDNAIIPMKERVVDRKYDPLVWLGSKIGLRNKDDDGPRAGLRESAQAGRRRTMITARSSSSDSTLRRICTAAPPNPSCTASCASCCNQVTPRSRSAVRVSTTPSV